MTFSVWLVFLRQFLFVCSLNNDLKTLLKMKFTLQLNYRFSHFPFLFFYFLFFYFKLTFQFIMINEHYCSGPEYLWSQFLCPSFFVLSLNQKWTIQPYQQKQKYKTLFLFRWKCHMAQMMSFCYVTKPFKFFLHGLSLPNQT